MVEYFAAEDRGAIDGEARTYPCSGWENLLTMSVMEAIYLSDRTGQPESPARLLETHNLSLEDCMQCTPPDTENLPDGESIRVIDQ